jgi:hypothetical protein
MTRVAATLAALAAGLLCLLALSAPAVAAGPIVADEEHPLPLPDPAEDPVRIGGAEDAFAARGASLTSPEVPTTWCGTQTTTDNTADASIDPTLPQFKFIYAYPSDRPNRFDQWKDALQANVGLITRFVSRQPNSTKAPRIDLGTSCGPLYLDIQVVALPNTRAYYLDSLERIRADVATRVNPAPGGPRNYEILGDTLGSVQKGLGQLYQGSSYDRADSNNIHNRGNFYSVDFTNDGSPQLYASFPGWQPTMVLHEMSHNMGAVQWSAPHTSSPSSSPSYTYSHCWDGYDVMCYRDGPSMAREYVTTECAQVGSGWMYQPFDCHQDDYFNPLPASGSYLATHWNIYDNVFMSDCASLPDGLCDTVALVGVPANTRAPSVSGSLWRGETLTANVGTWNPDGADFTYQWQRNTGAGWFDVEWATSRRYLLDSDDVAARLRVRVTARNAHGEATVMSPDVGPVKPLTPVNLTPPTVSGEAKRGEALQADEGDWEPAGEFSWQWQRSTDGGSSFTDIAGATNAKYTLTTADRGARVRAHLTASNVDGTVSLDTGAVGPVLATPPTVSGSASIAGTAKRGLSLAATVGSWSPSDVELAVQWQRDSGSGWTAIAGATGRSYAPDVADIGARLRLRVSASTPDGEAETVSEPVGPVAANPAAATQAPAVTGTATRGQTLTASAGSWSGTDTVTSLQWQRDAGDGFKDLAGATRTTYPLGVADIGAKLRMKVTGANPEGLSTAYSAATGAVAAAPPVATAAPAVSGTATRGHTLTGAPGTWTPGDVATALQWQRETGGAWTDITGATRATYQPALADIGSRLRVRVAASNVEGTAQAFSPATGAVASDPARTTQAPAVVGTAIRGQVLQGSVGTWVSASSTGAQWQRDTGNGFVDIAGARTSQYKLTPADIGARIRLEVTAANPEGDVVEVSAPTAAVAAAPPVAAGASTISGTATRGQTLTARSATWTPADVTVAYKWQRDSGNGFADIAEATSASYTLTPADVGARVRVQVTGTNPEAAVVSVSDATAAVAAAPPVTTSAPVLTGMAARGQTLTGTAGTWTPGDVTVSYQWQRDSGSGWAAIAGATASAYQLTAADVGAKLRLRVTGTNPETSAAAYSAASETVSGALPRSTGVPIISGTAKRTQRLTVTTGSWSAADVTIAYQWQRDTGGGFQDIAGATANAYTLTAADVGGRVRVRVTAANDDGSATAETAATATVAAAPPAVASAPTISPATGARTGLLLTAADGSWTPAGVTLAYKWERCDSTATACVAIDGATAATYRLTGADTGAKVRVSVTATNEDGSLSASSAAIGAVVATPANTAAPSLSGTLMDASALTADPGTWTPADGVSYAYQWLRCPASAQTAADAACRPTASGAGYTLRSEDVGSRVAVRVTATRLGAADSAVSVLSAVVAGRPLFVTGAPTISGTAQMTDTLRATQGAWSVPLTSAAYQWQRETGSGYADIAGAHAATYTLAAEDVGKRVRVRVLATSPGRQASADSEPSAAVAAIPVPRNTTPPGVSGAALRGRALRATAGTWSHQPTAFAYQWHRCDSAGNSCAAIAGATGAEHTATGDDVGRTLRVAVTGSNASGTGSAAMSGPSGIVGRQEVAIRGVPSITPGGAQKVGVTLVAGAPSISAAADTAITWQWQRCEENGSNCRDVAGATEARLTLAKVDIDHALKVVMTASSPDGQDSATSAATEAVLPPVPVMAAPVTLRGSARVGQTVTAKPGRWLYASSTRVQLFRCTTSCQPAADPGVLTYTLTTSDAGAFLRASEIGTGRGGAAQGWAQIAVGPVISPAAAQATVPVGQAASVRTRAGATVAQVTVTSGATLSAVTTAAAAKPVTVRVKRTKGAKGKLRAWACPVGEYSPCASAKPLAGRPLTFTLTARKVQVTVVKAR